MTGARNGRLSEAVLTCDGVVRRVGDICEQEDAQRVLVVASPRAVRSTAITELLRGRRTLVFSDFTPNPALADCLAGARLCMRWQPELIVAVGGGSALDTAKLIRSLPADRSDALRVLAGKTPARPSAPLVAVPTTAGSGSEVTRFAVVYVNGIKCSLDHPTVLPEYALVDPQLLQSCPAGLRYTCAYDALCHALESYWSMRSTPVSRAWAMDALRSVVTALRGDLRVLRPRDRTALARAATTAGRAIDITRTTAAHAFSYTLTSGFGVPHGVACMLNLLWLSTYNRDWFAGGRASSDIGSRTTEVTDILGALDADGDAAAAVRAILTRGGYSARWRDYGVRASDLPGILDAGLASERTANNPAPLERRSIADRMKTLL